MLPQLELSLPPASSRAPAGTWCFLHQDEAAEGPGDVASEKHGASSVSHSQPLREESGESRQQRENGLVRNHIFRHTGMDGRTPGWAHGSPAYPEDRDLTSVNIVIDLRNWNSSANPSAWRKMYRRWVNERLKMIRLEKQKWLLLGVHWTKTSRNRHSWPVDH